MDPTAWWTVTDRSDPFQATAAPLHVTEGDLGNFKARRPLCILKTYAYQVGGRAGWFSWRENKLDMQKSLNLQPILDQKPLSIVTCHLADDFFVATDLPLRVTSPKISNFESWRYALQLDPYTPRQYSLYSGKLPGAYDRHIYFVLSIF